MGGVAVPRHRAWSYAGLSSGGFAAAALPLIDHHAVHGVCALSGYFDAHIPVLAHAPPALRSAANATRHARAAPALTFLAYGRGDTKAAVRATRYSAALTEAGRRVIVRTYPGSHQWVAWRPAFAACFQILAPAR